MLNENQSYVLSILRDYIGKDDNGNHEEGRFVTWLREADDTTSTDEMSNEEIAAIALANGYDVYKTFSGYYGDEDYLVLMPKYGLLNILTKWNTEIEDQTGEEDMFAPDAFIKITLQDLFS